MLSPLCMYGRTQFEKVIQPQHCRAGSRTNQLNAKVNASQPIAVIMLIMMSRFQCLPGRKETFGSLTSGPTEECLFARLWWASAESGPPLLRLSAGFRHQSPPLRIRDPDPTPGDQVTVIRSMTRTGTSRGIRIPGV